MKDTVSTYGFDGLRVDTTPEVKRDFWTEYRQSAGVYTVGEIFNSNIPYVASYQGALDATLNYPFYWTLQSVFGNRQSMYGIRNTFTEERKTFKDTSILGNFIDNHDNPRFLNLQPSVSLMKGALTYAMTSEGIPIMYYGTEQLFNGG